MIVEPNGAAAKAAMMALKRRSHGAIETGIVAVPTEVAVANS